MGSPTELEQQILFGLSTLGQRNAHHEFEQLCLGLARRRITSNLMPATGPVSAGGDHSRDGESFWSNLSLELPGTSVFVSMVATEKVVLACTIQQSDVAGKIRTDIAVLGAQNEVERVAYFITGPLPVGKRHSLIAEALNDHQIKLEIWDCTAISNHLKDQDLFYLAVRFLHLPSSLAPEPPPSDAALPGWYTEDRQHWRDRSTPASTLGDLVHLRRPLRHATLHVEARADLPDWLAEARTLLGQSTPTTLRARARYEIAIATLRGMSTLRPVDDLVRSYFADIMGSIDELGLLEDATYMLEYGYGAYLRTVTDITRDELDAWHAALQEKVERLLGAHPFPNAEASLLALATRLALHQDYPRDRMPQPDELVPFAEATERVVAAVEAGEALQFSMEGVSFVDIDKGMLALKRLTEQLPNTPLFPVKSIADYFDLLVPGLVDHPLYETVRDALDVAVESIEGKAARGDRAQSRALKFHGAGRLLNALSEIHEAKINWWHGDTIEGGVIMSFLASRVYSELGLPIAAKQYAMSAAVAARNSNDPDLGASVARGFLLGASYEHQAGMWLSATQTFRIGLLAQHHYADEPTNTERYPYVQDMLVDQAFILRAARSVRPEYLPLIEMATSSVGLADVLNAMLAGVNQSPALAEDDYAEIADRAGLGRPFSDAGPTRRYSWAALGTTWTVECDNDRVAVLAAERFAAALQITLAELASHDALLLTGAVQIKIQPDRPSLPTGAEYCVNVASNTDSRWELHLTPAAAMKPETAHLEVTSAVIYVLIDRSLLSREDFILTIERAFAKGLWHKLLASRPYDEIADILKPEQYEELAGLTTVAPGKSVELAVRPGSTAMEAITAPAPGYDHAESLRTVTARYENMIPMVRLTLGRLAADAAFQATVRRLRGAGWLEWHLLTAVANLAGSERARRSGVRLTADMTQAEQVRVQAVMKQSETEIDEPMPMSLFSEEGMRSCLSVAILSTLGNLDLTNNQKTPDFPAIFRFLGDRYGYWTDDVPHDPIFDLPGIE